MKMLKKKKREEEFIWDLGFFLSQDNHMLHQLKNQSDFQCQPQALVGLSISKGATKWYWW